MKPSSTLHRPGFTARDRAMGMIGAWTAFVVNEAYAITSGLGYLSVKAPSDPISDPYLSIMSLLIVLMAPFLVITMVAVHSYAATGHKPYTSSVNFALFVVARQPAPTPSLWVSSFISTGWPPLPQAMDFFAWDWFFALSMLLAAPVFRGSRLENAVRILMLVTAALCILGLVWLPFSPQQATIIGILGWGVAGPIVFLLLANLFTRLRPDPLT
jgi:hypothetical protein